MPTKARKPPPDRRFVEADMQKPKMILFDYGHTLALEPEQDYLRGHRRVIELAAENPLGITPEELEKWLTKDDLRFLAEVASNEKKREAVRQLMEAFSEEAEPESE